MKNNDNLFTAHGTAVYTLQLFKLTIFFRIAFLEGGNSPLAKRY
jgi:hypothetical protein